MRCHSLEFHIFLVNNGNHVFDAQTVMGCCDILNKVIDPVRKTMPTATWPELIAKCYENGVDLSAKYMYVHVQIVTSE